MKKTYPPLEEAKRILQEKGIKSQSEYNKVYKELGLPAGPADYYKRKGWIDWYDLLGKSAPEFPPYNEAQRRVQEKGIQSQGEYNKIHKELGLPSAPHLYYKDKGWIDWPSLFGKKTISYPPCEEAKRIVLEKGIKSVEEYRACYKELGLPAEPSTYYEGKGWTNWYDFLDKEAVSFPPYEVAKSMVQEKGIKRRTDYLLLYKDLGLPSEPQTTYKDKGWTSWDDFFGIPPKVTSKERKFKILTKLSLSPDLLKDDANIKLIYMLASQLDKKLAKEIEELLEKSSYEERLDWVKEQLKEIKEENTPVYKITPVDELSEMESIIDEFGDLMEALPEEAQSDLNTIIENYIHSIVNKDLIAENDG